MRRATDLRVIFIAIGLATSIAAPARAQVVEVPPFTVATSNAGLEVREGDVTVAPDGNLEFLWVEMVPFQHAGSSKAFVRRVSLPGSSLGPVRRVDTTGWVEDEVSPSIGPYGSGGYIAAWNTFTILTFGYDFELYGVFLDGEGTPIGSDFEVGPTAGAAQIDPAVGQVVAGLPSGGLFLWIEESRLLGQLYDTLRQPVGDPLTLAAVDVALPQYLAVDATRDGGFVLLWSDAHSGLSRVRAFAADGRPLGPSVPVGPWTTQRIAANPRGGFAVIGTTSRLSVRRFDVAGALLGEDLIDEANLSSVRADLAFDEAGNLLVAWSSTPGGSTPPTGRYRAYDASGVPLGPPAAIDPGGTASRPRVASISEGRFVIGWSGGSALRTSVLSLCSPGAAVCGDGMTLSQCEACDDGPANSDVLPDACRTDCRRAHCGDGVLDSGEGCDDGNAVNGDCCSWRCRREPDFDQDGLCDDDCRLFVPDFDQDGVCDPSDDCRLFPDPDQSGGSICDAAPLENLTREQEEAFEDGLEEFSRRETPQSGLGPVFNGASCAECHHRPMIGGSSEGSVTRIGRDGSGGTFDPMTDVGGPVIQRNGLTTAECTVSGETVPLGATYVAGRNMPPLFGLGLVEGIADERILRLSDPTDRNGDGISGRPNLVGGRVGRFGWKADVATLAEFAALAYRDEMGVTSPAFPDEVAPQGAPPTCDPLVDPEDDGVDITEFTTFVRLLAPLPAGTPTPETRFGRRAFKRARCHRCHSDTLRTAFTDVPLRTKRVRLFSDLLLHDMGPGLADGIVQGQASRSEFRTAPLWGVRASAPYLHDGRAPTLDDAIAAHDGEAAGARDRYLALTPAERAALVAYLNSL